MRRWIEDLFAGAVGRAASKFDGFRGFVGETVVAAHTVETALVAAAVIQVRTGLALGGLHQVAGERSANSAVFFAIVVTVEAGIVAGVLREQDAGFGKGADIGRVGTGKGNGEVAAAGTGFVVIGTAGRRAVKAAKQAGLAFAVGAAGDADAFDPRRVLAFGDGLALKGEGYAGLSGRAVLV